MFIMADGLTKKVVKKKKLMYSGNGHVLVIPKKWLDELEWTRQTELTMEFLPHRKTIIISAPQTKPEPQAEEGSRSRDGARDLDKTGEILTKASIPPSPKTFENEEVSDIVTV